MALIHFSYQPSGEDANKKAGLPECHDVKLQVVGPAIVSGVRREAESCRGRSSPDAPCIATRSSLSVGDLRQTHAMRRWVEPSPTSKAHR